MYYLLMWSTGLKENFTILIGYSLKLKHSFIFTSRKSAVCHAFLLKTGFCK